MVRGANLLARTNFVFDYYLKDTMVKFGFSNGTIFSEDLS